MLEGDIVSKLVNGGIKTSFILLSAILASGAMLASCSPNAKETIEVYKDNSGAKIGNTLVRINDIKRFKNEKK